MIVCSNRELIYDRVVVELGCGLGLGSIGASAAGARAVFATDGDAELLELTLANAKTNNAATVSVAPLMWYAALLRLRTII